MKRSWSRPLLLLVLAWQAQPSQAALRVERFDRPPAHWEGIHNRSQDFPPRPVTQDFGYSPATRHAGGSKGEIGGLINPAGEAAYYGYPLPQPLSLENPMTVSGQLHVPSGSSHCLFGFFNTNTLKEWRTPNTLAVRINGRGQTFHAHLEYTTALWRANAGVIGHIIPGERITPAELPADQTFRWKLHYDPTGADGHGLLTFQLNESVAQCELLPEHRRDNLTVTHFGLLPVLKTWDSPGHIWLDDLSINGRAFDFSTDPAWDSFRNRTTYLTTDTRPRFDFGWSPTHHAGGLSPGELGGLIFRGDCREPARMACYGDQIQPLNLRHAMMARGKVAMVRGVTDSTASIGFYHSVHSMQSNPAQNLSIPRDYLGINIEGPSAEGFFFYPVFRSHGDVAQTLSARSGQAPRIYPDGQVHDWFLRYDPGNADQPGRITVGLDDQTCTLDLEARALEIGATFNRFGLCTPWIDGNSVTVFFDDLTYTCSPD